MVLLEGLMVEGGGLGGGGGGHMEEVQEVEVSDARGVGKGSSLEVVLLCGLEVGVVILG